MVLCFIIISSVFNKITCVCSGSFSSSGMMIAEREVMVAVCEDEIVCRL